MQPPADRDPIFWAELTPGLDWHPPVQAMFRYWRSIHPGSRLPGRQHLNPADIKPLLPGVWLLDIQPAPFRLRYRLVGTRVVQMIGMDPTGLWMDEAHSEVAERPFYFERYRVVADTALPSWRRGRASLWINEDFAIIENLVMPLSADGDKVDMLLAFTAVREGRDLAEIGNG